MVNNRKLGGDSSPPINSNKGDNMLFLGKSKNDWKALELYYRREWICFLVGFILGSLLW